MRVSLRLYVALIPAVLGAGLVVALAYWGERGRQAPGLLVAIAGIASLASFAMAWHTTRNVTRRIDRLTPRSAGLRDGTSDLPDELDAIEQRVSNLTQELAETQRHGAQRIDEYARYMTEALTSLERHLDEVRLPLHVLLDTRFGDLNDNQEEMLDAASNAAVRAHAELRRVREIASLDIGLLQLRREPLRVSDLWASLVPALRSRAGERALPLQIDVEPALPVVDVDPVRLREALAVLLRLAVERASLALPLTITWRRDGPNMLLMLRPLPALPDDSEVSHVRRIVSAHEGALEAIADTWRVRLPIAGVALLPAPRKG